MENTKSRLTPIKFHHIDKWHAQYWLYQCRCGNQKIIKKCNVDNKLSKSCGCLRKEKANIQGKLNKTHGERTTNELRTKEYLCWVNIKNRCYNPKSTNFEHWGGRGITMFSSWVSNYQAFLNYILFTIGRAPGPEYSIDRINNDGNYEPGNLRWATRSQQNSNQRKRKRKK